MDDLRIPSIIRKEKVILKVNGKEITAYRGETVLAALIAAGYRKTKNSAVGSHPRGALCGMGVCFECAVVLNGEPNVRACMTEVENNMEIEIHE